MASETRSKSPGSKRKTQSIKISQSIQNSESRSLPTKTCLTPRTRTTQLTRHRPGSFHQLTRPKATSAGYAPTTSLPKPLTQSTSKAPPPTPCAAPHQHVPRRHPASHHPGNLCSLKPKPAPRILRGRSSRQSPGYNELTILTAGGAMASSTGNSG